MRAAARLVMGVVVPIVLVALGPASAGAHQSPPGLQLEQPLAHADEGPHGRASG